MLNMYHVPYITEDRLLANFICVSKSEYKAKNNIAKIFIIICNYSNKLNQGRRKRGAAGVISPWPFCPKGEMPLFN